MIIKSENLTIVSTASDGLKISKLLSDNSILENLSETRLYSKNMKTSLIFRIEINNIIIGEISLKSIRWNSRKAEVSVFLTREYQDKGYGKKTLQLFINYFFDNLNMHRLEAEIYEYNKRAQTLFEKLGFVEEGRLREAKYYKGNYYDIICYGMLYKEFKKRKLK